MGVGDITEVVMVGRAGNTDWLNVFHYQTVISIGNKAAEYLGLIDALEEVWFYKTLTNDALDLSHGQVRFEGIRLRDIADPSLGLDYAISPVLNGVRNGERNSQQLATLIQKKTARIGRSYRGRTYLATGVEEDIVGGTWNNSYVVDVLAWYETITNIISIGGTFAFSMVVYSSLLGTSELVSNVGVVGRSRTQRRRSY